MINRRARSKIINKHRVQMKYSLIIRFITAVNSIYTAS